MPATRQVLFIQGGGAGAHDDWDAKLVHSLRGELGDGYEVRYPRMPHEVDPSYARWSSVIGHELAALADGAVAVGHSVGLHLLPGRDHQLNDDLTEVASAITSDG